MNILKLSLQDFRAQFPDFNRRIGMKDKNGLEIEIGHTIRFLSAEDEPFHGDHYDETDIRVGRVEVFEGAVCAIRLLSNDNPICQDKFDGHNWYSIENLNQKYIQII